MYRHLVVAAFLSIALVSGARSQTPCDGKQIFTEKVCAGDKVSADEQSLFDLVAKYRASKGLPAAKLSPSLSMLANRHLIDIKVNVKSFTHSWSNCPYDIKDEKTWPCIIDAPTRLKSGYPGQGFETLYVTAETRANIGAALDKWKASSLHNSIITNQGIFKDLPWDEIGVAVDANYAALWFGTPKKAGASQGLGVTYEQVVAGLTKVVAIKQESSNADSTRWQGTSPDKKIKLEISGTKKDISEAKMAITAKLEADGKLSPQNFIVLSTLLKNTFPAWADRETWLQSVLKIIGADHSASQTKVVGKNFVEVSYGAGDSINVQIVPQSAKRAIEMD